MSGTKRPFSWTEMGQLRPKQLKMKRGGVEGFQPTQEFYGTGTELDPIVIEEGVMDTIYILAPSSTGGSEFIPVPTMYPTSANVPVQLNNYFRFEEVEADTTAQAGEAEEAVVTSVVPSVSISVPAVQPPVIEPGYSTPRIAKNRFTCYNFRHYYRTRFGTRPPSPSAFHLHVTASRGANNPRSILSSQIE